MNKIFFMGAALTIALAFTSCKSSESAYKKAYEKAQAAQQNATVTNNTGYTQQQQTTTPVEVTPVQSTTQTTTAQPDYSNVKVRTENVTVVSGDALKAYSVVVGSFSVQANALALQSKLNNGNVTNPARVVKASVNGSDWYRVIAGSFNTKQEAAAYRATQQGTYPDAWLLYSK